VRIALSLLAFRPGRIGGAETYVRKLIAHLPSHAGSDSLVAVMDRDLAAALPTVGFERLIVGAGARRIVAERILETYAGRRARGLARAIDDRADVVLFPQQSIFPLGVRARAVVVVHDLQHLAFPQNFGLFDTTFRARAYPASLARADRIVAISEVTRRELAGRCAIEPSRVQVIPHGLERVVTPVAPWSPGTPFLYYPAATHAHKGHDLLLRAFAGLRRRGLGPPRLVLSGQRTSLWGRLEKLGRELGVGEDVIHLGFLPGPEVDRVYAGADAVVFPTRFEGFGLPVLEAVERGKRVIVSRLSIFDELGVPRRWQIDFSHPDQLAAALALEGPTVLEKQPWTWSQVADRTLAILREAARGDAPRGTLC
jgi:glycosyltransferase involved in cell wall biosynthesis